MDKKTAYEIVFNDLMECSLFRGQYDAKHGSPDYMYGICTVMEQIAYGVSEDNYNEFSTIFTDNVIKSQERARE